MNRRRAGELTRYRARELWDEWRDAGASTGEEAAVWLQAADLVAWPWECVATAPHGYESVLRHLPRLAGEVRADLAREARSPVDVECGLARAIDAEVRRINAARDGRRS